MTAVGPIILSQRACIPSRSEFVCSFSLLPTARRSHVRGGKASVAPANTLDETMLCMIARARVEFYYPILAYADKCAPEYIAITLGLPDRATKQQQERGVKGVE